jgi:DNA-binding protein YbaB
MVTGREVGMFGEDRIGDQLAQVRETLSKAADMPGAQADPIMTEASEGRIKVTLGPDGRFERIKMTLSALKDGPEALVSQLTLAVNEAIDLRAERTAPAGPVPDMAAMNEQAAKMQDASVRQFEAMGASISDLMTKLYGGR